MHHEEGEIRESDSSTDRGNQTLMSPIGTASARVAYTLEKIIPAAHDGPVETLFVAAGVP